MRVLSVLGLLLLGLGLGYLPSPAAAAPCPMHAGAPAAAAHEPHGSRVTPAVTKVAEVTSAGGAEEALAPASRQPADHAVPEGQPCCHIAGTAAPPVGPALAPRVMARASRARAWLPPRAAPSSDIFRPPASA